MESDFGNFFKHFLLKIITKDDAVIVHNITYTCLAIWQYLFDNEKLKAYTIQNMKPPVISWFGDYYHCDVYPFDLSICT